MYNENCPPKDAVAGQYPWSQQWYVQGTYEGVAYGAAAATEAEARAKAVARWERRSAKARQDATVRDEVCRPDRLWSVTKLPSPLPELPGPALPGSWVVARATGAWRPVYVVGVTRTGRVKVAHSTPSSGGRIYWKVAHSTPSSGGRIYWKTLDQGECLALPDGYRPW